MPTSSIKKNFNVIGIKQLETFVKADVLSGIDDLRKLALLREKHGFTY